MRKIRWGVLGTAGIAYGQTIPGMQLAENCELYAIAGRNAEKAAAFAREFGFEKIYTDYDALLNDPRVEAVYIPLPNTLHCEWTLKALKAKKHVLCEKPLAPTEAEAAALFRAAEENGVLLMEAFAYLHSPIISAIKEELDSGVIGDVRYMETAFLTSDYDHSNIRMRRETCGGSVYDLGCYCTSQILWMLGREPEKVQAIADYFPDEHVDKLTSAILTFGEDCRAAFSCGMVLMTEQGERLDRLWIRGMKGSIKSDVEFNQCGDLRYTVTANGKSVEKIVPARQKYCLEVEQMGRRIESGEPARVTEAFTRMNLRTIERVLKAINY